MSGRSGIAGIFARFDAQPEAEERLEPLAERIVTELDNLQKKNEMTRFRASKELLALITEHPLTPRVVRQIRPNFVHTLKRAAETTGPDDSHAVLCNLAKALAEVCKFKLLDQTNAVDVAIALFVFRESPLARLVELCNDLLDRILKKQSADGRASAFLAAVLRELLLKIRDKADDRPQFVANGFAALASVLDLLVVHTPPTEREVLGLVRQDPLLSRDIFRFTKDAKTPLETKAAALAVPKAIVSFYGHFNEPVPDQLLSQTIVLWDSEPEQVIGSRLELTLMILNSKDVLDRLTRPKKKNDPTLAAELVAKLIALLQILQVRRFHSLFTLVARCALALPANTSVPAKHIPPLTKGSVPLKEALLISYLKGCLVTNQGDLVFDGTRIYLQAEEAASALPLEYDRQTWESLRLICTQWRDCVPTVLQVICESSEQPVALQNMPVIHACISPSIYARFIEPLQAAGVQMEDYMWTDEGRKPTLLETLTLTMSRSAKCTAALQRTLSDYGSLTRIRPLPTSDLSAVKVPLASVPPETAFSMILPAIQRMETVDPALLSEVERIATSASDEWTRFYILRAVPQLDRTPFLQVFRVMFGEPGDVVQLAQQLQKLLIDPPLAELKCLLSCIVQNMPHGSVTLFEACHHSSVAAPILVHAMINDKQDIAQMEPKAQEGLCECLTKGRWDNSATGDWLGAVLDRAIVDDAGKLTAHTLTTLYHIFDGTAPVEILRSWWRANLERCTSCDRVVKLFAHVNPKNGESELRAFALEPAIPLYYALAVLLDSDCSTVDFSSLKTLWSAEQYYEVVHGVCCGMQREDDTVAYGLIGVLTYFAAANSVDWQDGNATSVLLWFLQLRFSNAIPATRFQNQIEGDLAEAVLSLCNLIQAVHAGSFHEQSEALINDLKKATGTGRNAQIVNLLAAQVLAEYVVPLLAESVADTPDLERLDQLFFRPALLTFSALTDFNNSMWEIPAQCLMDLCAAAARTVSDELARNDSRAHQEHMCLLTDKAIRQLRKPMEAVTREKLCEYLTAHRTARVPLNLRCVPLEFEAAFGPVVRCVIEERFADDAPLSISNMRNYFQLLSCIFGDAVMDCIIEWLKSKRQDSEGTSRRAPTANGIKSWAIMIIGSIVAPAAEVELFLDKEPWVRTDENLVSGSMLVSRALNKMDGFGLLISQLLSLNPSALDLARPEFAEQRDYLGRLVSNSSELDALLADVTDASWVCLRKAIPELFCANADLILASYPKCIGHVCRSLPGGVHGAALATTRERNKLYTCVERWGNQPYLARMHQQADFIRKHFHEEIKTSVSEAGYCHFLVWDNHELQEGSLELDVVIPSKTAPVGSMPKIMIHSDLPKYDLVGAKVIVANSFKADPGLTHATNVFAGMGGHSLVLAVTRLADSFRSTFQDSDDCVICYCRLDVVTKLPPNKRCDSCSSIYHDACLKKWFASAFNTRCPMCRRVFL